MTETMATETQGANTIPHEPTWEPDFAQDYERDPGIADTRVEADRRMEAEHWYRLGWIAGKRRPQEARDRAEVALEQVADKVVKWERERKWMSGHLPVDERIDQMIRWYRDQAVRAFDEVSGFREDLISHLRALVIVNESALSAGTHREKDARMRGLVSVVEQAIEKLREYRFKSESQWYWPDVFRSDYPVRQYLDRIRELEGQVATLTAAPAAESSGQIDLDDTPL